MSPHFWTVALLMASMFPSAHVDDWPWPEPTSYHSRGFGFVAEIFPPGSRQNPGDRAKAFFYRRWGTAMEFGLEDGRYAYGTADEFPDLSAILAAPHPDEETEIWATSLRFSSITDVVQARP